MAVFTYNFSAIYDELGNLVIAGADSGSFTGSADPDSFTPLETLTSPIEGQGLFEGSTVFRDETLLIVTKDDGSSVVFGTVRFPDDYKVPPALTDLGTIDQGAFLVCFLEGTRIATPEGERAVESLAIGDLVLTADGRAVPVKWVGCQRIRNPRVVAAPKLEPVCITAGALGNGLPHSDLFVTAAHGMVWEGLVVNAGALVNGTTIRFVPLSEMPEVFTWYHIETEGHEEILAHGAPTETFVDYVGRSHFDNHQEYLDLYGAERIIPEMKRPRVSAQRMLPDHLRARLGLPAHGAAIAAEAEAVLRRLKAA
jgi:hypothetical protein